MFFKLIWLCSRLCAKYLIGICVEVGVEEHLENFMSGPLMFRYLLLALFGLSSLKLAPASATYVLITNSSERNEPKKRVVKASKNNNRMLNNAASPGAIPAYIISV